MLATFGACALGMLFGLRHALDPDHLAAVATLVDDRRGALVGVFWGTGHALALLVVGMTLAAMQAQMPPELADGFELAVAAMLLVLGARAVRHALVSADGAGHAHRHGGRTHVHGGPDEHVHVARWTFAARPLLVGLIHGLAGSGALTALVLAELPDLPARLAYTVLFGLGTIGGMVLFSTAAAALFRRQRSDRMRRGLALLTGVVSVALGVAWGTPLVLRFVA
jgi:hypothetical protein